MNRCAFCSHPIEQDTDTCSHCGRNAEGGDVLQSPIPRLTKVGFDEVMRLAVSFMQSIVLPVELIREMLEAPMAMFEEVLKPVLSDSFNNAIISEAELSEKMDAQGFQVQMWALPCFGLGVEEALGNLPADEARKCLSTLSSTYWEHAMIPLDELFERGLLTKEEALAHGSAMWHNVEAWSSVISDLGRRECKTVRRNNSAFLKAVRQLDEPAGM